MELILKAKDIRVEFKGRDVLDIDNLEVYDYDRIGLVGANGAGKSTLFKVLLGELTPLGCKMNRLGELAYIRNRFVRRGRSRRGITAAFSFSTTFFEPHSGRKRGLYGVFQQRSWCIADFGYRAWRRSWHLGGYQPHGGLRQRQSGRKCSCAIK